jgi:nicotinamide-nucleotide amidase
MPHDHPIATAEILAVGAELLIGETRDTNSGDIAAELTALGVEVTRMCELPDDVDVITEAVRSALARVDLVVTTGGLGPTPDDLTREGIAAALGEEPTVVPELEAWLREIWSRRGLPFSDTNLKQAWLIPSATAMPNPLGTAPGWWVEVDAGVVIALPGPPRELHPMWIAQALPRLRERGLGLDRAAETLRLTGIGESALVDVIGQDLLAAENPRMATYARPDSVDIRISAIADGSRTAEEIVAEGIASLSPRIDRYVFGRGEEAWPEALDRVLDGRRLATVEIGTAGYLGLLLGTAPWLVLAKQAQIQEGADAPDPIVLASGVKAEAGTEIGLAAIGREGGDDMRVEIGLDIEGVKARATQVVFRGGDAGRRRSANAAAAELWRRLRR